MVTIIYSNMICTNIFAAIATLPSQCPIPSRLPASPYVCDKIYQKKRTRLFPCLCKTAAHGGHVPEGLGPGQRHEDPVPTWRVRFVVVLLFFDIQNKFLIGFESWIISRRDRKLDRCTISLGDTLDKGSVRGEEWEVVIAARSMSCWLNVWPLNVCCQSCISTRWQLRWQLSRDITKMVSAVVFVAPCIHLPVPRPLLCCAEVTASMFHLSAYAWVIHRIAVATASLSRNDPNDPNDPPPPARFPFTVVGGRDLTTPRG